MDLDEEGRTVLGFWGLGRREWDGRWRKKKKKRTKMVNRKLSLKDSSSTWILVRLSFASQGRLDVFGSLKRKLVILFHI